MKFKNIKTEDKKFLSTLYNLYSFYCVEIVKENKFLLIICIIVTSIVLLYLFMLFYIIVFKNVYFYVTKLHS